MTWREYHELTKHSVESLRRTRYVLDWENMPDPFRHYEGVPVLDLPADPPDPESPASDGPLFLSQLLFHSAAISASKRVPSTGSTYALRVNPSSGNLHPTEFHFITRGIVNWSDGLYHYRPSSHMAEQRALGQIQLEGIDAPLIFVLTSIAWREAWKYRDRAYRYCLHDIGHAWQALVLAAGALGCGSSARGRFGDDDLVSALRLEADEWPMLIVALRGSSIPLRKPDGEATTWFGGVANRLSLEVIEYPSIQSVHRATKVADAAPGESALAECKGGCLADMTGRFGRLARTRRSALDFRGGSEKMTLIQLLAILQAATRPFCADFGATPFIQLYLYVHRVEGLEPGVYLYQKEGPRLQRIQAGDQRVAAAGLSLGQDLAGNACVTFSMIADLDGATAAHGDRGYRYAHFEAGAIGHRLYIAAEAHGMRATGIGAFYDNQVHRYLNLTQDQGQVIYHFAIGHAVRDPRLEA